MIVKVQLPPRGEVAGASITSEDRRVAMFVPLSVASKRLERGERAGYFQATLDEHGILELGDRVPAPIPAW
jgi:hypothetical protein